MRIMLVCDYSLTYLGGAQTAFLEQARALNAAGHDVMVIAPTGFKGETGATADFWVRSSFTIPVVRLPILVNSPRLRRRLRDSFIAWNPDIVHVHSELGLSAAALAVAHDLHVPTVHTVHTFFWDAHLPYALQKVSAWLITRAHSWITKTPATTAPATANEALCSMTLSTAARVDVVISPSEHQRQKLLAAGAAPVIRIANTTSRSMQRRPQALQEIDGPLRIAWVGRCAQEKRLIAFIDACILALDTVGANALEIEVIGDGATLRAAKRRARNHPSIRFIGRIPSSDVFEHLGRSHLLALTSIGFDNQPMTIVEALFSARPVLYVDPDLTDGLDAGGFLCTSPTAEAIAAKIIHLARNHTDVLEASARARAAYGTFDARAITSRLEKTYKSFYFSGSASTSVSMAKKLGLAANYRE